MVQGKYAVYAGSIPAYCFLLNDKYMLRPILRKIIGFLILSGIVGFALFIGNLDNLVTLHEGNGLLMMVFLFYAAGMALCAGIMIFIFLLFAGLMLLEHDTW